MNKPLTDEQKIEFLIMAIAGYESASDGDLCGFCNAMHKKFNYRYELEIDFPEFYRYLIERSANIYSKYSWYFDEYNVAGYRNRAKVAREFLKGQYKIELA